MTFSTVCTCFRAVNLILSGLDIYKQHAQDGDSKSHGCAPESAISEQRDLLLDPGGIHPRGGCMNKKKKLRTKLWLWIMPLAAFGCTSSAWAAALFVHQAPTLWCC